MPLPNGEKSSDNSNNNINNQNFYSSQMSPLGSVVGQQQQEAAGAMSNNISLDSSNNKEESANTPPITTSSSKNKSSSRTKFVKKFVETNEYKSGAVARRATTKKKEKKQNSVFSSNLDDTVATETVSHNNEDYGSELLQQQRDAVISALMMAPNSAEEEEAIVESQGQYSTNNTNNVGGGGVDNTSKTNGTTNHFEEIDDNVSLPPGFNRHMMSTKAVSESVPAPQSVHQSNTSQQQQQQHDVLNNDENENNNDNNDDPRDVFMIQQRASLPSDKNNNQQLAIDDGEEKLNDNNNNNKVKVISEPAAIIDRHLLQTAFVPAVAPSALMIFQQRGQVHASSIKKLTKRLALVNSADIPLFSAPADLNKDVGTTVSNNKILSKLSQSCNRSITATSPTSRSASSQRRQRNVASSKNNNNNNDINTSNNVNHQSSPDDVAMMMTSTSPKDTNNNQNSNFSHRSPSQRRASVSIVVDKDDGTEKVEVGHNDNQTKGNRRHPRNISDEASSVSLLLVPNLTDHDEGLKQVLHSLLALSSSSCVPLTNNKKVTTTMTIPQTLINTWLQSTLKTSKSLVQSVPKHASSGNTHPLLQLLGSNLLCLVHGHKLQLTVEGMTQSVAAVGASSALQQQKQQQQQQQVLLKSNRVGDLSPRQGIAENNSSNHSSNSSNNNLNNSNTTGITPPDQPVKKADHHHHNDESLNNAKQQQQQQHAEEREHPAHTSTTYQFEAPPSMMLRSIQSFTKNGKKIITANNNVLVAKDSPSATMMSGGKAIPFIVDNTPASAQYHLQETNNNDNNNNSNDASGEKSTITLKQFTPSSGGGATGGYQHHHHHVTMNDHFDIHVSGRGGGGGGSGGVNLSNSPPWSSPDNNLNDYETATANNSASPKYQKQSIPSSFINQQNGFQVHITLSTRAASGQQQQQQQQQQSFDQQQQQLREGRKLISLKSGDEESADAVPVNTPPVYLQRQQQQGNNETNEKAGRGADAIFGQAVVSRFNGASYPTSLAASCVNNKIHHKNNNNNTSIMLTLSQATHLLAHEHRKVALLAAPFLPIRVLVSVSHLETIRKNVIQDIALATIRYRRRHCQNIEHRHQGNRISKNHNGSCLDKTPPSTAAAAAGMTSVEPDQENVSLHHFRDFSNENQYSNDNNNDKDTTARQTLVNFTPKASTASNDLFTNNKNDNSDNNNDLFYYCGSNALKFSQEDAFIASFLMSHRQQQNNSTNSEQFLSNNNNKKNVLQSVFGAAIATSSSIPEGRKINNIVAGNHSAPAGATNRDSSKIGSSKKFCDENITNDNTLRESLYPAEDVQNSIENNDKIPIFIDGLEAFIPKQLDNACFLPVNDKNLQLRVELGSPTMVSSFLEASPSFFDYFFPSSRYPGTFKPVSKLGQGTFGTAYLVAYREPKDDTSNNNNQNKNNSIPPKSAAEANQRLKEEKQQKQQQALLGASSVGGFSSNNTSGALLPQQQQQQNDDDLPMFSRHRIRQLQRAQHLQTVKTFQDALHLVALPDDETKALILTNDNNNKKNQRSAQVRRARSAMMNNKSSKSKSSGKNKNDNSSANNSSVHNSINDKNNNNNNDNNNAQPNHNNIHKHPCGSVFSMSCTVPIVKLNITDKRRGNRPFEIRVPRENIFVCKVENLPDPRDVRAKERHERRKMKQAWDSDCDTDDFMLEQNSNDDNNNNNQQQDGDASSSAMMSRTGSMSSASASGLGDDQIFKKKKSDERERRRRERRLAVDAAKQNLERMQNEAHILSNLCHPNIVGFIDYYEDKKANQQLLFIEYVDGGDLFKEIERRKRPPVQQQQQQQQAIPQSQHQRNAARHGVSGNLRPALPSPPPPPPPPAARRFFSEQSILFIFVQLVLSVEYLHRHNIIHRDIKTQNVLMSKHVFIKLTDFGTAKQFHSNVDKQVDNKLCGTPLYLSPELFSEGFYSQQTDMWSLGVVLYELLTCGDYPFTGRSMEELSDAVLKKPPNPIRRAGSISQNVLELSKALLNKKPNARPTAKQVLTCFPCMQAACTFYVDRLRMYVQSNHETTPADRMWLRIVEDHIAVVFDQNLKGLTSQQSRAALSLHRGSEARLRSAVSQSELSTMLHQHNNSTAGGRSHLAGTSMSMVSGASFSGFGIHYDSDEDE